MRFAEVGKRSLRWLKPDIAGLATVAVKAGSGRFDSQRKLSWRDFASKVDLTDVAHHIMRWHQPTRDLAVAIDYFNVDLDTQQKVEDWLFRFFCSQIPLVICG